MGLLRTLQLWRKRRSRRSDLRKSVYWYGVAADGFAADKDDQKLANTLERVRGLAHCGFSDVERRARAILRKYTA